MHVLPGTSRDFVRLREDLGAFGRLAGFMVGIREKETATEGYLSRSGVETRPKTVVVIDKLEGLFGLGGKKKSNVVCWEREGKREEEIYSVLVPTVFVHDCSRDTSFFVASSFTTVVEQSWYMTR